MSETLPIRMTATLVDASGTEADCTTYAYVDPTSDNYDLTSVFYAWLTALDAVTDAAVMRASYTIYPPMPSLKTSPTDGSQVALTGLLTFTGPTTPRRDSVAIPSIATSKLAAGKIIVSDTDVQAFITFLQTGGTGLEPTTSDWDGPLTFKDTACTFRQYNRQLTASSTRVGVVR